MNQFDYGYDLAANRSTTQQSAGQVAVVGGSATSGDTIKITVFDKALSGGQEVLSAYTVNSGDSSATIAGQLAAIATSNTNLQTVGINATPSGSSINFKS